MAEMTTERFAQRAFEVGLLDTQQLKSVWSELGTEDVSLEQLTATLIRQELLTSFQTDRIIKGERVGYFYGKYKPLYMIGSGSFARVYRAVDMESGRVVAVKVLRKRHRDNIAEFDQFLREGKVGAALRHINVVPIYEVDGDPKSPFMVMEFVEGQTLREMMLVRKTLDSLTAMKILCDVVAGLVYAYEEHGITHRDMKLSNVLITSRGRGKLVDFGLAALKGNTDDEIADTPNARAIDYATLERGTHVRKDDRRSDIFFCGCILYHMLSGQPPLFETKDRIQRLNINRFRDIVPLHERVKNLPLAVLQVCSRAMEMDPEKRYQSPREMLVDVKRSVDHLENRAAAPTDVAESEARKIDNHAPDVPDGVERTLLLVESHIGMQNLLRDRLKRRGYRVLIIADPSRAISRFDDNAQAADCVVFCTTDLEREAVEAFNSFGKLENTKDVPAILMLDSEQTHLADEAESGERRVVLAAPKLRQLRATLLKLLAQPV
jgi:serine/threonine-protein kinase